MKKLFGFLRRRSAAPAEDDPRDLVPVRLSCAACGGQYERPIHPKAVEGFSRGWAEAHSDCAVRALQDEVEKIWPRIRTLAVGAPALQTGPLQFGDDLVGLYLELGEVVDVYSILTFILADDIGTTGRYREELEKLRDLLLLATRPARELQAQGKLQRARPWRACVRGKDEP